MKKNRKISIVIPAYNTEKYISKCLNSIVGKFYEIIVINDGSKDNTLEILKQYNDIKIIDNINHGVSYSRNVGIDNASGDYIMFVDSDDYLKDDFLNILNHLDIQDEDVIYFSKNLLTNLKKEELIQYIVGMKKPCIAGPFSKLFKRKFLLDNNIRFKEDIINGEDMLFNMECLLKLKKFSIKNKSVYMYRQVLSSTTKKYNKNLIESDIKFHIYLNKLLSENNITENQKNNLVNYTYFSAVFTIIDRAAYLEKYKFFRNELLFLKKIPYKQTLNMNFNCFSKKKKILLLFLKLKLYRFVYFIEKIKHKKIKSSESFVEI